KPGRISYPGLFPRCRILLEWRKLAVHRAYSGSRWRAPDRRSGQRPGLPLAPPQKPSGPWPGGADEPAGVPAEPAGGGGRDAEPSGGSGAYLSGVTGAGGLSLYYRAVFTPAG